MSENPLLSFFIPTDKIKEQQVAIGDATTQQLAQQISEMDDLRIAWEANGNAIKAAGFDLNTYIQALASGTGAEYIQGLIDKYYTLREAQSKTVYQQELLSGASANTASAQQAATSAMDKFNAETGQTIGSLQTFSDVANSSDAAISETVSKIGFASEVTKILGGDLIDGADAASTFSDSINSRRNLYNRSNRSQYNK